MNKEQELKRKKSPVSIKNKKASFDLYCRNSAHGY